MERSIFLLVLSTTCAGFKVSAPAGRVVGVRGLPVILGCEFTDSTSDLSALVVTWQRVEDSRVVHSFYYQQDQLGTQNGDYRDRTALFVSELRKGNASLRLASVGLRDAGEYLCTVSNIRGTDKARVRLEYGAFYTEPRLSVNVSSSNITLRYEAEGFPKPEVRWVGENGEVLSDHIEELSEEADGPDGPVYNLKSSHVLQGPSRTVVFTLKNQLLDQDLNRSVSITYDGENPSCGGITSALIAVCVLCSVLCLVLIACILVIMRQRTTRRHSHTLTNGTANGTKENGTKENGMLMH